MQRMDQRAGQGLRAEDEGGVETGEMIRHDDRGLDTKKGLHCRGKKKAIPSECH